MENTYILVLLAAALIAIGVVLLVLRSRASAPPEHPSIPAEILPDPIAAVPPEAIAPAMPAAIGPPDELTRLKGLGPKAADRLNALGIVRYDQLAALSGADLARVDDEMGAFKGRIARDRWVEQAGHLAAGDTAGFEAKFGKLG